MSNIEPMIGHEDSNRIAFEGLADSYLGRELYPAERALLTRLKTRLPSMDMLDLGVGAGRTAHAFSALTRAYLGIDYAESMIRACKARVAQTQRVSFALGDAADPHLVGKSRFDLILFSFNGLDYVGADSRSRILRNIHGWLRDEKSRFFFSTHDLRKFPFRFEIPRWDPRRPLASALGRFRAVLTQARADALSRGISADDIKRRGWAILNDGAHRFRLATYYVMPEHQIRQLGEAGFEVECVLDGQGQEIGPSEDTGDWWFYYLCRPRKP